MEMILKSVNKRPQPTDGPRYLIESTWPENLQDLDLSPYRWIQELVPSYELVEMARKHRWNREYFQRAYWLELERPAAQEAIQRLFSENDDGYMTFLYAAPEAFRSNAYSLKRYISANESRLRISQPVAMAA